MVQPKFKLHMSSSFYAVYCLNLQTEIYLLFFLTKYAFASLKTPVNKDFYN